MAGDWIKMTHALITSPEVVRIVSALNADKMRTIGALYVLWCVADQHAQTTESGDGMLVGYTLDAVDGLVQWPGFAEAVRDAGWLRIDAKGLILPNFWRHNGKSAKRRATESSRKNRVRKMSASHADKMRLEKRREEKSVLVQSPSETASPDPAKPPAPGQVAGEWGQGRIRFRPSDGTFVGIEPSDHALWANAYPAVDIPAALARAAAWCVANPAKGRKSNYAKFLASWLSREQDRGGSQGPSRRPAGPESRPTAAQIHAKRSLHEFED